jgi:transglutaminase-like putative cysteine protease
VPVAAEVLRRMSGDCNEHTALYVALARAAGIPSRVALGLVYEDGFFCYHAWPEIYAGRWIAVDPTLGQFPADAPTSASSRRLRQPDADRSRGRKNRARGDRVQVKITSSKNSQNGLKKRLDSGIKNLYLAS